LTAESIDVFRAISDKWHKWLDLVSRATEPKTESRLLYDELKESTREELDIALKEVYGPGAVWRGKQLEVVTALTKSVSPLMVVLPTGAGKSIAFHLPAKLDKAGSSLVLTPYVALANDMVDECKENRIDVYSYGKGPPRAAKVIVAVMDCVANTSFKEFARGLSESGKLDRVILDEVQSLETDVHYRPNLEAIRTLDLPVPLVLLTATSPDYLTTALQKNLHLRDLTVIREPSHKPNFTYGIEIYEDNEYEQRVLGKIKDRIDLCENYKKVTFDIVVI